MISATRLSLSGRLWESPAGCRAGLDEQIGVAAAERYSGMEIRYPMLPARADIGRLRDTMESAGLRLILCFLAGVPQDSTGRADAARVMDFVRGCGGTHVRVAPMSREDIPALRILAAMASDRGLALLLHVHTGTMCDSADAALDTLDAVAQPAARLLLDPAHLLIAGDPEPGASALRLAPHSDIVNVQCLVADAGGCWRAEAPSPAALDLPLLRRITAAHPAMWFNVMPALAAQEDPATVAKAYREVLI